MFSCEYDGYCIDSDDDFRGSDSDDDKEVSNVIIAKYSDKQSDVQGLSRKELETQKADEFETLMNNELEQTIYKSKRQCRIVPNKIIPNKMSKLSDKQEDGSESCHPDDPCQSNTEDDEDLFYDPQKDDKDEAWVLKQRQEYTPASSKQQLPTSDATLNCPACMTTLCFDCQRHAAKKNQYRAMFVRNCRIVYEEKLICPLQDSSSKKRKKQKPRQSTNLDQDDNEATTPSNCSAEHPPEDEFHPVKCSECDTTVAVIDSDEVYHFFNVLSSHA